MKKILVANRGEIAVRVIQAIHDLGYYAIAVYTQVDKESMHVHIADEAVCLGSGEIQNSYLSSQKILSAAQMTGAHAIHPGYGMFSEKTELAQICAKYGVTFIAPDVELVGLFGNKVAARQCMMELGIPVLPGTGGLENLTDVTRFAAETGYPIILKSALGGGGKGIRMVANEKELIQIFPLVMAEARSATGRTFVYAEKYLSYARHVEFQFLGDRHGGAVHLFERECSVQRRNQKLIEETPSPALSPALRTEIGSKVAHALGSLAYHGVGTVEFLFSDDQVYFMEINPRIQVEHPITEAVTGVDLVREQILVSMGEPMSVTQADLAQTGHAIEYRIQSEDPIQGFLPSVGVVENIRFSAGPGVRWDTYLQVGTQISPFYDSLQGKLIISGRTREEALLRSRRALRHLHIQGIPTTIPFFLDVLQDSRFLSGAYHIGTYVNNLS